MSVSLEGDSEIGKAIRCDVVFSFLVASHVASFYKENRTVSAQLKTHFGAGVCNYGYFPMSHLKNIVMTTEATTKVHKFL